MCFCSRSLDVSADVFTVEKKSAADMLAVIGDTLLCSYEYNGSSYSTTFTYQGTVNASTAWRGLNVDNNEVFVSVDQIKDYDFIIFSASTVVDYASFGKVHNVIVDMPLYFESYARGGFAMTSPVSISDITNNANSIISYPNNYANEFRAICGNTASSASLADYYGIVSGSLVNGSQWNWRPILYKIQSGGRFTSVHFDNVIASYDSKLYFGIWCPYVGGSMETAPLATTTTSTTTSSALASFDINVTVDVDLSPVVSEISGVAGEVQRVKDEVTGIATDVSNIGSLLAVDASETAANMSLEPLGTMSSIDYDHILDDADEVMEDLPNALVGTASLWAMISALVDTNAIWLWLIPLCMLLCFLSVMLWRS